MPCFFVILLRQMAEPRVSPTMRTRKFNYGTRFSSEIHRYNHFIRGCHEVKLYLLVWFGSPVIRLTSLHLTYSTLCAIMNSSRIQSQALYRNQQFSGLPENEKKNVYILLCCANIRQVVFYCMQEAYIHMHTLVFNNAVSKTWTV
jgi:hypothetical protein